MEVKVDLMLMVVKMVDLVVVMMVEVKMWM